MVGLIGKKVGMTQIFNEAGELTPVTVISVEPNVVVSSKVEEVHGYNAIVLGAIEVKESKVTKVKAGQFKGNVTPRRHLVEVRDFEKECEVGDALGVELFEGLRYVDIIGTSKGVMRRHNFKGGRETHGSKFHREGGSTGMAAWPSKVIKGTKMAGHMGGERKTIQNLSLVRVDAEKKILLVKGAVPGAKNSMVLVRKAKKKS
jgi:large subunit ribosomal protein L3